MKPHKDEVVPDLAPNLLRRKVVEGSNAGRFFHQTKQPSKGRICFRLSDLTHRAGIIFIGIREFFYPGVAALGFGVPLLDPRDADLLAIKACRDVVAGILALTFLGLRNRRFLAYAIGVMTLIPVFDGLIVLRHAAWEFTPIILIHWGTAALMLATVELLRSGK